MKSIIAIVFLFFSVSVFAQGKFDTQGDLAPTGAYGIVKAKNLRGGYLGSVYDTTARNAIPLNFRDSSTLVYTILDSTMWILRGGLTDEYWRVFSAGSSIPNLPATQIAFGDGNGKMTSVPEFNFNPSDFSLKIGGGSVGAYKANFFGQGAGGNASNATFSNFFGSDAGSNASQASISNFIGYGAGIDATNANNSNFFGLYAGSVATNANNSNFFGQNAGSGATNASNSIFIGRIAGLNDTVNNTNNEDDYSILLGKSTSTGGFKNSVAIGGNATNTATNQMMIGSSLRPLSLVVPFGNVGINKSNPTVPLDVVGQVRIVDGTQGAGKVFTSDANGYGSWVTSSGGGSGVSTLSAIGSTPNANGATITGTVLNLQPASASFGGVVTTGPQTFAGAKYYTGNVAIGTTTPTATTALEVNAPTSTKLVDFIGTSGQSRLFVNTTGGGGFSTRNAQFSIGIIDGGLNSATRFLTLGSGFSYIDAYSEGAAKSLNYDLVIGSRANNTDDLIAGNTTAENGTNVQIGFQTATKPSAILSLNTVTRGFLPPRMTATQASAIASPEEGLMIYVTNTSATFLTKGWYGWNGSAWEKLNN